MSVLDALLVLDPAAVCPDDVAAGRAVAERVTGAIEGRLNRELVVRPHGQPALRWMDGHGAGWARQWPVVLLASDRPTTAEPLAGPAAEVEGAAYAHAFVSAQSGTGAGRRWNEADLGDETGERLGLPYLWRGHAWAAPWWDTVPTTDRGTDDARAVYLAGYRRPDQAGEAGRAAVNAAVAEAHPAWGPEAISADVWARVPVLPSVVREVAAELARGYQALDATGLGALASRTEDRADSGVKVQLARGWDKDVLADLDGLAWLDL